MKILVAGGAGYLGSRLVPELVRRGHEVTILDCLIFGHHVAEFLVPFKNKNIRNVSITDLQGFDAVINLAGFSNDPTADLWPELNYQINTEAAIQLAEMCVKAGVPRYVLASTCSIYYTEIPVEEEFTENSPVNPKAHYSRSKLEAERGILPLARDGFAPVALRMGTIYGYSPRMRYDLVVNTMLKDAFTKAEITVCGGSQWRPLLRIDRAVDAYVHMLEAPAEYITGQVYNVLTGNYQVHTIASIVSGWLMEVQNYLVATFIQEAQKLRSYRVSGEKFDRLFPDDGAGVDSLPEIWRHLNTGINPEDSIYHNIRWMQEHVAA